MKTYHGFTGHPLYNKWRDIKQRCENPKAVSYDNYGARGIALCDEWKNNPSAFIYWALGAGWKNGLEIDRIDNDGDYSPENCRFVTKEHNRINTRLIRRNNSTGYRGVNPHGQNNCFSVCVRYFGKRVRKSGFRTATGAALYRDACVIARGFDLPLNFPQLAKAGG